MVQISKYISDGNQIIDIMTAEVIDTKGIIEAKEQEMMNTIGNYQKEINDLGGDVQYYVNKKRNIDCTVIKIKEKYLFKKVFVTSFISVVKKSNLSINTKAFLFVCQAYLSFPYNSIFVDGQYPDINKLIEISNLKKTSLYQVFKELEKEELIKKIKDGHGFIIYINPFVICSGLVHIDTYNMFKNSKWSNIQIKV